MVRAEPAAPLEQHLLDLAYALVVGAAQRAGLLRRPAAGLHHVQPHNLDPGGDQQAHHELTDQAEPITQAVSPRATSERRTPCMAMAPTVANAACSAATLSAPERTGSSAPS